MKMFSVVLGLMLSSLTSAAAFQYELKDFGGDGGQIYYGTNESAWVYRNCKVTLLGTKNTPVVQVTISDSQNAYVFWTYSPSFTSGRGGDILSATLSDSMNLVHESDDKKSRVYSNVGEKISSGGIAEMKLSASSHTGKLKRVQLVHYDTQKERVANEIICTHLKKAN